MPVGICIHSAPKALVKSGTNVGQESLGCSQRSDSSQWRLMKVRSGLSPGHLSSYILTSANRAFLDLALCTGVCHAQTDVNPSVPVKG